LGIRHSTVKNTATLIYKKMGVADKTQAVVLGLHLGLIDLDAAGQSVANKERVIIDD
jgi:hypothetical protein